MTSPDAVLERLMLAGIGAARAKRLLISWDKYDRFRAERHLADDHDAILLYLTWMLDARSMSGPALRNVLRAIDTRWVVLQGRRAPSRDIIVRNYLLGLHQEAALGPTRNCQPIYREQLIAKLHAIAADRTRQAQRLALLYLTNATRLSVPILARLTWNDIRLYRDHVVITVPPPPASTRQKNTLVVHVEDFPLAVASLRAARCQVGPAQAPLFAAEGEVLPSCTTISKGLSGRHHPSTIVKVRQRAPRPEEELEELRVAFGRPSARQLRDRALLLLGFTAALRTAEAIHLAASDITVTEQGLVIHIPGRRTPTGIPRGRHLDTDPVGAWTDWQQERQRLGYRLDQAAFPAVRRRSATGAGLTHHVLGEIVEHRAAQAHLEGEYSFESLRTGLIRSALREGVAPALVMQQSGLQKPSMVALHQRREQLISHSVVNLVGL